MQLAQVKLQVDVSTCGKTLLRKGQLYQTISYRMFGPIEKEKKIRSI